MILSSWSIFLRKVGVCSLAVVPMESGIVLVGDIGTRLVLVMLGHASVG
jgi:hypothetical protein